MIGGLQGEFGDLDIKYLKQNISKYWSQISGSFKKRPKKNISKCWSRISGSFKRTLRHCAKYLRNSPGKRYRHCAKWLRNSPSKRYQWIRICLVGEVETPSFPIWICLSDVKYPEKVERHPDRILDVRYLEKMERRKGNRFHVHGVGTPPPDDTERASLSGSTSSGFLKLARGTCEHHTPGR